jgi:hypothetical protein
MEKFTKCNAEMRSQFRTTLINCEKNLRNCFKDEQGEISFKKVVDINELKMRFVENGVALYPEILDDVSALLTCFGNIEYELCWGDRVPPETLDEEKARKNLENREDKLQKLLAEKEKDLKAKK